MKELINKATPDNYYSGGFLFNPETKQILLHKRDDKTENSPNLWAFFGGANEIEDQGNPLNTFLREINEELGIKLVPDSVKFLTDYYNPNFNIHRFVFYAINQLPKSKMKLGEGIGFDWVDLDEAFQMNISKRTRQD